MKYSKKKAMTSLVTLSLMMIMMISIFALPNTIAHTPAWIVPTYAYVSCTPDVIGIGQPTTIVVWLDKFSPTATGESGQYWSGFKLTITQPDGSNIIIGPWKCGSAVASDFKMFTPTQVGNYSIVFSWPGENVSLGNQPNPVYLADEGDVFLGATSAPTKLVVQQEQVPAWPEPALPKDYWTRPINNMNRGWSSLPSNWLKSSWLVNNFQRWGTGPKSAHVLWTKPITEAYPGGIVDEQWPTVNTNCEDYLSPWGSCIIMNGIIYYNTPRTAQTQIYGYYAVNLQTGEQIWYKNGTDNGLNNPIIMSSFTGAGGIDPPISQTYPSLTCGQLYHYYSVNGGGILSYLWMQFGTTWYMLDASTGNLILTLKNVPSGTSITDQDGSLLRYSYSATTGNLLCWNSSQAIYPGGPIGTGQQTWRPPTGSIIDAVNDTQFFPGSWSTGLDAPTLAALRIPHSGYTMNVTIAKNLPGSMTILQDENRVPKKIFGSAFTSTYTGVGGTATADSFQIWLVTINEHATDYYPFPGLTGTQQNNLGFTATLDYSKNITVPITGKNYTWSVSGISYDSDIFTLRNTQTMQVWVYRLSTGNLLWGPTPFSGRQMDYYGMSSNTYYGKLLVGSTYGGTITAYDAETGEQLWVYTASAAPYTLEAKYDGTNMPLSIGAVCDGMIYTYSNEHSPTNPLYRQSYIRCINITDGTLIWKLPNYMMFIGTPYSIADGYLVTASDYDNLVYCIGKGPSGMTVSAPQTDPTLGASVTITGTITDQSTGAIALAKKMGYMNGVACVSDANQEAFMSYLYEQQTKPSNAIGVPVSLDALDPNGNLVHIGETTSDLTGTYGYKWTPEIPGTYQIIATFAGSNSYGGSSAQAYMSVSEPAPTASPIPVATQPPTEMYFALSTVAIIIAIAIVGAVVVLMLRKHP